MKRGTRVLITGGNGCGAPPHPPTHPTHPPTQRTHPPAAAAAAAPAACTSACGVGEGGQLCMYGAEKLRQCERGRIC